MASSIEGELKNCDLFLVWRSVHGDLKLKADLITHEIMVHYALDDVEDTRSEIQKCAYNLSKYFSKLWEKYHRKEKSVLKHEYFSKVFVLPQSVVIKLPSTSSERGRKKIPFSESSDCVKRRKTAQLRTEHSADELTFASAMKLREEGKRAEATIITIATQSTPTRATRMLKSVRSIPPATCISYSSEEALALICDTQLTVAQYTKLRLEAKSRNANLYPAYKKILDAKRSCYPEKNSITITETNMEIKLQALLDHTVERIILTKEKIITNFSDEELQNLLFTVKYGYDGSGDHAEYKQIFSNDDGTASDSHIFATSIVPINIVVGEKNLFENPRPSSTRFCRPLHLQFAKETALLIAAEKASLDSQIAELQPVTVECFGRSALVKFKMLMTMVDGKVCNAVTSTSSQRCYICGATPSQMNNLSTVRKREENEEPFQFGLSILHAYIRFFEYLLHLSYRLEIKKWQIRTAGHKQIMLDKKKYIQSRFKTEIGLIVDKPRSGGCGNSNDGNTARRFFQNWEQSAEITGINREAIYRCKIILETLVSGCEIDCKKFEEYALETAHLLVNLYDFYPMPASVHKILIHGSKVISSFLVPIGQLSEEAQESRNKDIRRYREDHTRKFSRLETNTDLLHRLLETSDPLISSIRGFGKKKETPLSRDAKNLLVKSDDNTTDESDSSDDDDQQ